MNRLAVVVWAWIGSGVAWGFGVGLWGVVGRSAVGVALRR